MKPYIEQKRMDEIGWNIKSSNLARLLFERGQILKKNKLILFFKKNIGAYGIGVIFVFLAAYIQTLFPKVLGETIDILKLKNFDPKLVKLNIFLMIAIGAGTFLFTYAWRNLIIGNGRKLECYLREMLFDHLQKLSPEFYSKRKTGDLIAYATNDVSAVRMAFGPAAALAANGLVICIASIYSMAQTISLKLTFLSLLPIPFVIFFMLKIGQTIHKKFRKVQENFAGISDRIQENIYGIRVIKSYVQEDAELANFELLNKKMKDSNISMVRISSLLTPIIEILFSLSFVLNLIIGGRMVLDGEISLGGFIAFNTYLVLIMRPIVSIGRIINIFQRGTASLKRLKEIFDVVPTINDVAAGISKTIEGEIEFRNLNFSYPGSQALALENISIKIPKGRTLGIIGKTGSGKSTITNLLLKLFNVEPGALFLDEVDIMEYSLGTLRESMGYVPQDDFLFSASLKENISFFNTRFSDAEIESAAKHGCIYESIAALPDGFDTILGDRGVNLSGGQKQRVAIARGLIRNPKILILDDALSSVDAITEAQIITNLKNLRKDKTSIFIAHKISTVMHSDEIIVLDHGKIAERGTHEQLISEGGLYYEIFQEQYKNDTTDDKFENL